MVSISQICRKSGLARSTVYAALSQSGRLRESTRLRVLKIANEMGYRANHAARSVARGKFNCFGYTLSGRSRAGRVPHRLTIGVLDEAAKQGQHVLLARGTEQVIQQMTEVPQFLKVSFYDGLLVDYTDDPSPEMLQSIFQTGLPTVWLNAKLATDCLYPNEYAAGRRLAEMAMEAGHRRIMYAHSTWLTPEDPSTASHFSARDRRDGVLSALRQSGLTPVKPPTLGVAVPPDERLARCVAMAESFLRNGPRPTAIIGYDSSDTIAYGAACLKLGLRVPEDLSLICFSDLPAFLLERRIGFAKIPEYEMGRAGVTMLLRKIDSDNAIQPAEVLPFSFEPGDTLCPPAA